MHRQKASSPATAPLCMTLAAYASTMGVWAERSALGLVIVVRCVFVDGGIGGGACAPPRTLRGSAENRQGYHGAGPRQMHVGNRLASAARHLSVAGRNMLIRRESAASFGPVEHCGRHPARAATRCRRLTARATSQATPPMAVACPCHTRHSSYGLLPSSLSPSAAPIPRVSSCRRSAGDAPF